MEKEKLCQSCAMLMQTPEDYGTEKNNEKRSDYCKFCYQHGAFVDEGITMQEKIKKCYEIATKMGMDEKIASEIANNIIPQLKRWQT